MHSIEMRITIDYSDTFRYINMTVWNDILLLWYFETNGSLGSVIKYIVIPSNRRVEVQCTTLVYLNRMYYIKLYKQVIACNVWFDNHIKTIFKVKCRAIKYQRCGLNIDIMYLHQMNRLVMYWALVSRCSET